MKNLIVLIGILFSFSAYCQLSEKENKALDELIATQVEIEADVLKSSVLKTLFDAEFFKLKRTPHYNENGGYSETILMKQNGKMLEISEVELLVPVLKSSFKLSSEAEAQLLKSALRLLLESGNGNEDEIVQKGSQWILVTEEWFGDKNGYVVSTENGGTVSKIEYKSKLEL